MTADRRPAYLVIYRNRVLSFPFSQWADMRSLVIGDIHGGYRALQQCLRGSRLDYEHDRLVVLGDAADGWSEVAECFEELLKVNHLVYVRGNHDQWLLEWLQYGKKPLVWLMQGGYASYESYASHPHLREKHLAFLKTTGFYFIDEDNRIFVHGGILPGVPVDATEVEYLMWDRELWMNRSYDRIPEYTEVYVGHTSIWSVSSSPCNHGNVWFMDTGAGWGGKLSIMDVATKEIWQSDRVADLYPEEQGRS